MHPRGESRFTETKEKILGIGILFFLTTIPVKAQDLFCKQVPDNFLDPAVEQGVTQLFADRL